MRATAILVAAVAMSFSPAYAATAQPVDIYVQADAAVPVMVQAAAEQRARKILAEVGVSVRFHGGSGSGKSGQPISIRFVVDTPQEHPGALAYAFVFDGARINVMYDRIRRDSVNATQSVLSYVLVHEITHVLEGVDRHSLTGIMKARWTQEDEASIRQGRFRFDAGEAEYIEMGLRVRYGL